jgi:DNA-binding LytR/AlgR family response regulator
MIAGLIAEDEEPQRAELRRLLAELWPELTIVAECQDGLAAVEAIAQYEPSVVFLDIRMPGVNGIEVARAASTACHVVFTTAYDEYAVQAFERGAIDYLLKPIQRERLQFAIARVQTRLRHEPPADLAALLARLQSGPLPQPDRKYIRWITASIGQNTRIFPIEDVLFFRAQDKYTRVVTVNEEAYIRMPLRELIEKLDPEIYWQVHRSVIVRCDAIRLVRRDDSGHCVLIMRDREEELPVSSVFQQRFKAM